MNTYRIEVNNTTTHYITITADNEKEAIDKAFNGGGVESDDFHAASQIVEVKLLDGE